MGLRSQTTQRSDDQHRQLELYALRRAQPVKAGECVGDEVWASKTGDGSSSGVEHWLQMTTQGSRDFNQGGFPVVQATQYQRCDYRLIDRRRDWTPDATMLAQHSETRLQSAELASSSMKMLILRTLADDWKNKLSYLGLQRTVKFDSSIIDQSSEQGKRERERERERERGQRLC